MFATVNHRQLVVHQLEAEVECSNMERRLAVLAWTLWPPPRIDVARSFLVRCYRGLSTLFTLIPVP